MNTEEDYLIHELADKSGVSVRTIRYYIAEGLLPAPDTKGRYATFNEEYRLRLELIRRLKEAFLPLKEIRDRISGLDPAQIQHMLDQISNEIADPSSSRSHILAEGNQEPYASQPLDSALNYLARVTGKSAPAGSTRAVHLPAASPSPRSAARPNQDLETWQRVVLAPGLELSIRSTEEPFYRERIRQLIEFAKIQFS